MTTSLVLGPLVRHVDEDTAAIWVQTSEATQVTVQLDGHDRGWSAPTFAVHGHHYALVEVTGLAAGTDAAYQVELDGVPVLSLREIPLSGWAGVQKRAFDLVCSSVGMPGYRKDKSWSSAPEPQA